MSLFGRRPDERAVGTAGRPQPASSTPSKSLAALIRFVERSVEERGSARVLLCGPPSGSTIEAFSSMGARVTVDGGESSSVPLEYEDDTFEVVLGFDQLDLLDDERAVALAKEWARVVVKGGRLFILARREEAARYPRVRAEVRRDGTLDLTDCGPVGETNVRSNRQVERVVKPLKVDEVCMRRDGLREIVCKKG